MSYINIQLLNPLTNEKKTISVNTKELIKDAKKKYHLENHNWLFNGQVLQDNKTFEEFEIENDDVIISQKILLG